jgi:hypothetical protein
MARIPQYVSNNRASTEAPAVMQRDERIGVMADPNLVDNSAATFANKQLAELGAKITAVENANDNSKAEIQTKTQMLSLEEQVNKDPTAFEDYDNIMQKIGDSGAKQFRNPEAREEFKQKFGLENVIFKHKLQGIVYKKEVDLGRTNTLKEMDLESSNYINAQNDADKLASRQKIEEKMAGAIKVGLFTHEQGMKEVEDTIKSADTAIKDNKELAKRKEKELAWAKEAAVNAREDEFLEMKRSGVDKANVPVSSEELIKMARNEMKRGDITPKFTELYINALTSPKTLAPVTDHEVYKSIMDDIINPNKKASAIRNRIEEEFGNGKLSKADYKSLLYTKKLGQEPIFTKARAEEAAAPNPLSAIWDSIVKNFSSPRDRSEVMSGVAGVLQAGGDSLENASKVIKDVTKLYLSKLHYWYLTIPKGGTDVMDKDGNVSHVNEDGDLEEGE